MNMSDVITDIKMDLGIYMIALPFENIDSMIQDVIQRKTIKTFSQYQPTYSKYQFNLNSLEKLRRTDEYTTYLLPDIFRNREILFVRSLSYLDTSFSGADVYGLTNKATSLASQYMLANATASVISQMVPKMTFEFRHPREIDIYNVVHSSILVFDIAFCHDKNLGSIPETCRESFLKLATLDVKKFLYANLKHYDQLDTAFGTISLKIDDWANADQERKDLISEWDETYHIDITPLEFG